MGSKPTYRPRPFKPGVYAIMRGRKAYVGGSLWVDDRVACHLAGKGGITASLAVPGEVAVFVRRVDDPNAVGAAEVALMAEMRALGWELLNRSSRGHPGVAAASTHNPRYRPVRGGWIDRNA